MSEGDAGTYADLKDTPLRQLDDTPPDVVDQFRISQTLALTEVQGKHPPLS